MKLMVLNFSGNVGKSIISQYLLLPRINDAVIVSVETINSDKNEAESVTIKGNQFSSLINSAMIANRRSIIVDVGASNAESFLSEMASIQGAHEEFDYFIIPVTPIIKQQEDTISTIKFLLSLGVNKEKILVVFNMVNDFDLFEDYFSTLINFHLETNSFDLNRNLIISNSEFYAENKGSGKTIEDIVDDDRDFKELIRISRKTNPELIPQLSHDRIVQMLARGVKRELDEVFYELFGANQIK